MGQKTHPIGFRLAVRRNWESRWYADKKNFSSCLEEDYHIRKALTAKLKYASVPRIFIERASNRIRVKIYTARPGIVIGRKGQELEKLKAQLNKLVKREVMLDIQEIKKPELEAQLIAENVALQLERRISFRRAMKKAVQIADSLGAQGIKIRVAGRLGGADIARAEMVKKGRVPLHTLREDIDYGFAEANTVYGIIGVKCWVLKENEEQS
ncbi:30S ribosomal protein S3 [Opitutia bacterium ISCC 51]|jgi:small subunit ribosomal protein S3|nr:30S ribosomal protein S3 [Opitutae bacterium ISCC 51]QXD27895.1 30S ribosomal protein S3 [Opitutae bacterium ISCC 52]